MSTDTETQGPDKELTAKQRQAAGLVNKSANDTESKVERSGQKVTVGCKLANGMILQLWQMRKFRDPILGGGHREVERAVELGEPIKVHGPAFAIGQTPKCLIVGGYALTPNVDRDFWVKWLEQNKDHQAVKSKVIFAMNSQDAAQGMAEDLTEVRSGIEPLVPDKDTRIPRAPNRNITGIKTAEKVA